MPESTVTLNKRVLIDAVDALKTIHQYLLVEDELRSRREFVRPDRPGESSRLSEWCWTTAWTLDRVLHPVPESY